ncbi:MAG: hypothetical protein MJY92_03255 [Bacteroidales bacterium]|nr:hypothetical protein [Bacteroidales bacterium]
MKKTINIVLYTLLSVIFVAGMLYGLAGAAKKERALKCGGLEIRLLDSTRSAFITAKDIQKIIDRDFGGYLNVPVRSVDLHRMELLLQEQGMIESQEAYFTGDGVLHIDVTQRRPFVKLRKDGELWYICSQGKSFPVRSDWCKDIMALEGSGKMGSDSWRSNVAKLGEFILESNWKNRVKALECNSKGEISLKIDGRSEYFLLGQAVNLQPKFERISRYLDDGASFVQEGRQYRSVNVEFDNQIVCR